MRQALLEVVRVCVVSGIVAAAVPLGASEEGELALLDESRGTQAAMPSQGEPVGEMGPEPDAIPEDAESAAKTMTVFEIRRAIAELDSASGAERAQRIADVLSAIEGQSDGHVKGELSERLRAKLSEMPADEEAGLTEAERSVAPNQGEQESLEALRQQAAQPLPSEDELRTRIDALSLDPQHPEIGLAKAMEIGTIIERIQDPQLQARMRILWEDRVFALQGIGQ